LKENLIEAKETTQNKDEKMHKIIITKVSPPPKNPFFYPIPLKENGNVLV